jgi:transcriptional regulator with PAS, ATPase and Fis domain
VVQSKLLRALEEGVVRRVGASTERPIDVRVVATTNRAVEDLVERGLFRRDLYYRVAVFRIELPPLRERLSDVSLLTWSILSEFEADAGLRLSPTELRVLGDHDWPGNVRELRNVMQRWLVARMSGDQSSIDSFLSPLSSSRVARRESTPASDIENRALREATRAHERSALARPPSLASLEAAHITRVLEEVGNNRSRAASMLGISRSTLRRKLRDKGET